MNEREDLLSQIKYWLPRLSKSQHRIAAYLLEHYEKAAYMTAARLGEAVGVSESTVVRFAYELGYDGYPKLQEAMAELVRTNLTPVQRIEVTSDRLNGSILKSVLEGDSNRIRITLSNIDEGVFNSAVDEIMGSEGRLYIIGGRSSAALANFLGFYMNLMIDNVRIIQAQSTGEMFEEAHRINDKDVIIGISFPRYSQRTLKAMEYAKSQNAKVIVITDRKRSPMTKFAHYSLIARSDMVSFVDSLVAPMSVINALLVAISMRKKAELSQTLSKLENIWTEYDVYAKQTE